MYLYIDLPRFDFPVIFSEAVSVALLNILYLTFNSPQEAQNQATIPFAPPAAAQTPVTPVLPSYFATDPHLWTILDPEIARENPVEDKHRRLVRSHRSSPYDRELKPNAKIRDELNVRKNHYALMTSLHFVCRKYSIMHPPSLSTLRRKTSSGSFVSTSHGTSAGLPSSSNLSLGAILRK